MGYLLLIKFHIFFISFETYILDNIFITTFSKSIYNEKGYV